VVLLLAADQKTRIARVGGDEIPAPVAGRLEPVAGAPDDFIVLVADDIGCAAAVPGRDRADDPATAVAYEIFLEHWWVCFQLSKTVESVRLASFRGKSLVTMPHFG
jgi:hypothetical protein